VTSELSLSCTHGTDSGRDDGWHDTITWGGDSRRFSFMPCLVFWSHLPIRCILDSSSPPTLSVAMGVCVCVQPVCT